MIARVAYFGELAPERQAVLERNLAERVPGPGGPAGRTRPATTRARCSGSGTGPTRTITPAG
jgi:hypothetical protein